MAQKQLSGLHQIVRDNVQALLDEYYAPKRGQHSRFHKANRAIALSKIQRVTRDGGANLETLQELATAFKLAGAYQLLIPKLNAKQPQIAIERRYVTAARQMAKELAEAE